MDVKQGQQILKVGMALAAMLILCNAASACLNGFQGVYGDSYNKSISQYPYPIGQRVDTQDERVLSYVDAWKWGMEHGEFRPSSDYGLYLVYDKKYEEAEALFRKLAAQWPEEYAAAANLGTVLEINGKNEEALHWIQRAVTLNPTAHEGSEWLHVKILEAKVHPELGFDCQALLGVRFGAEARPIATLDRRSVKNLQKQLFYQLNERISFIPPTDPQIAALMFELGNTTLSAGPAQKAYAIYKLAQEYGCVDALLPARLKLARSKR